MYKGTTWTLALLIAAAFTADVFAQTDMTQNIPHTDTAPEIDGIVDDLYPTEGDGVFELTTGRAGYEGGVDSLNLSVAGYAMWDDTYLYLVVVIQDDILIADNVDPGSTWQDDSVELYIDGHNDKCQSCYDENDTQYRFRPGFADADPPMIFAAGNPNATPPTEDGIIWTTGFPDDGTGYVIEIALPLEKNDVTAQTNAIIGFDLHVNDADNPGLTERQGKLHWADSPGDNQWQHAHQFGTVTLVGGGGASSAVAQIRRTPSGGVRVGVEIEFDGSASTAPGTIQTYQWDFGDGTTAEGAMATHTYTDLGEYTVSLTVTDDGGISDTNESAIKVYSDLGTPSNPLEIPMATAVPTIDGEMDAAYASAQVVPVMNRANGVDPLDASDLTIQTYLMWDADNLYVLYDVTDDTLSNDSGNTWEDDSPELYIDGGNEKRSFDDGGYDENDLQYEFGWGSSAPTGNSAGNAEGVTYAVVDKADGTGYVLEAVVPWARATVTPAVGLELGLELMLNDDDSAGEVAGSRQTKASWFAPDGQDVAYQDPSAFGTVVLVDELGTAAENPSEQPGGFAIESMYPNPFNPTTTALLSVEQPGEYAITVYNLLGQAVHKQTLTVQSVGQIAVPFDLRNQASGMYLFSLQNKATGKVATSRAMLLK